MKTQVIYAVKRDDVEYRMVQRGGVFILQRKFAPDYGRTRFNDWFTGYSAISQWTRLILSANKQKILSTENT